MIDGKQVVLNYCSQLSTNSIEHLQNAIDNKILIEQGNYEDLNGCPSSYGLDEFEGLCFTETLGEDWKEQSAQCERCWRKALGV